MAMRFVALLIPLAITLPQLQMSRPRAPEPQPPAALTQPAIESESTEQTRHTADTAATRVAVAESPPNEALSAPDSAAFQTPVVAAVTAGMMVASATEARKAPPKRIAPKLTRASSPVKLVVANTASGRTATRSNKRLPADSGCLPNAHCAPVVVAKVTPVIRHPL